MRFLSIVRAAEGGAPPTQEAMDRVEKLVMEGVKAGWLLSAEGLLPSKLGFRVSSIGGKLTVTDGPFTEAKEIIGGFSIFTAASKEEAIALTKKFAEAAGGGDAETEVRQLYDMPAA
jgi:hypothetical protein